MRLRRIVRGELLPETRHKLPKGHRLVALRELKGHACVQHAGLKRMIGYTSPPASSSSPPVELLLVVVLLLVVGRGREERQPSSFLSSSPPASSLPPAFSCPQERLLLLLLLLLLPFLWGLLVLVLVLVLLLLLLVLVLVLLVLGAWGISSPRLLLLNDAPRLIPVLPRFIVLALL